MPSRGRPTDLPTTNLTLFVNSEPEGLGPLATFKQLVSLFHYPTNHSSNLSCTIASEHFCMSLLACVDCVTRTPSVVGIICSGSDASTLRTCALLRTGIFRIGKLQLAYNSIKVVRKNKNQGVESDRFPHQYQCDYHDVDQNEIAPWVG